MDRDPSTANAVTIEQPRQEAAALIGALLFPTLVTLTYFVWLNGAAAVVQQGAYFVGKALQFGFPAIWVFFVRRERVRIRRPVCADLFLGWGAGLVLFIGAVTLYFLWFRPAGLLAAAEPAVRAKLIGVGLQTRSSFIALAVFYALIHSLLEEYYWRWFVFGRLRRLIQPTAANLISSVGFAAHHVIVLAAYFGWLSPATWLCSLGVAIGGAGWAWLYQRSGSLPAVWGSHALVDAAIFVIGFDLAGDLFAR